MRSTWGLYVVPLCFGRVNCSALSRPLKGQWTASKSNNLNQTTCMIYNSAPHVSPVAHVAYVHCLSWNSGTFCYEYRTTSTQLYRQSVGVGGDMCYFVHTHGSWNDKKHTSESNWITPSLPAGMSVAASRVDVGVVIVSRKHCGAFLHTRDSVPSQSPQSFYSISLLQNYECLWHLLDNRE
jgi:hypothetical protein